MSTKNTIHNPTIVYQNKPRYQYVPVQETITSDELGTYVTYSVSVRTVSEEIAFIRDVSTDFEEIRQLTERCTEQQRDPVHLNDLIEDFLADSEMVLN